VYGVDRFYAMSTVRYVVGYQVVGRRCVCMDIGGRKVMECASSHLILLFISSMLPITSILPNIRIVLWLLFYLVGYCMS